MTDTHVLVLAMSTFPNPLNNKGMINQTCYKHENEEEIHGIGQLEAIPQLIQRHHNITHMIILQTEAVKKPCRLKDEETPYDWEKIFEQCGYPRPFDTVEGWDDLSAIQFFKAQMNAYGIHPDYILIDIDENNPKNGLEKLLKKIRELYNGNTGDWKLWLDMHGGFRDISMAMFSLIQYLSTTDIKGIPKLTDTQKLIEITDVYTIQHDPNTKKTDLIQKRTAFYRDFATDAFKSYMNYGQYFLDIIKPYDGDEPYAFVSYKHNSAEPARLAILGILKEISLRYWYDDGIKVGDEWSKKIDQRNNDCSAFILLLTKDYFDSQECCREFNLAREQDKPMIIIVIDQAEIHTFSQLESYASRQHIDLKTLITYDVLQKDSFKKKLVDRAKELQLIGEWD